MKQERVPTIVKLLFIVQFIGVVMLGLSTMTISPLWLAIFMGGGSGLVVLAFLIWAVLLVQELRHYMKRLDTGSDRGTL